MLSPLSPALAGSSVACGSEASLMSGSACTTIGASPGCQLSMLSAGAPSEEEPKNRLAVLTEKPSCDGAGSSGSASGSTLRSSSGWASSDNDTSYCGSGGALSAACSSGSSGKWSAGAAASAVLAPRTGALQAAGSSSFGELSAGATTSGCGVTTRRSPFRVRSTLGKSEG